MSLSRPRKPVASYRLSEQAKDDLELIDLYGIERFGEAQADRHFQVMGVAGFAGLSFD